MAIRRIGISRRLDRLISADAKANQMWISGWSGRRETARHLLADRRLLRPLACCKLMA